MDRIVDLMLAVRERTIIFYHRDTKQFDYCPVSEIEQKKLSADRRISYNDLNNVRLPSHEEINHKEIMGFFVKECVKDKAIRKQLFDILRRDDYMDAYLDKLYELKLYDDFVDACGDTYFKFLRSGCVKMVWVMRD